MKQHFFATALTFTLLTPSLCASAEDGTTFVFPPGTSSCATWLSTPEEQWRGKVWILGVWSGANSLNRVRSNVGHGTDGNGIFAAVEAHCRADMSALLYTATMRAYWAFQAAGR